MSTRGCAMSNDSSCGGNVPRTTVELQPTAASEREDDGEERAPHGASARRASADQRPDG